MLLLLPLLGFAAESTASDADLAYAVCVHCHGAHGEGRPELWSPRIGDLDASYVSA